MTKITPKVTTETRTLRVATVDLPGIRGLEACVDGEMLVVGVGFQNWGRVQVEEQLRVPAYLISELIEALETLKEP